MKDKTKLFKLLIDEYGLDQAVQISGLSKLEFIKESGIRIDLIIANDILRDLFKEKILPTKYKNCQLTLDSLWGTLDWYCDWGNETTYTYATPFWEYEPEIPVNTNSYKLIVSDGSSVLLDESDLEKNGYTGIKWKYGFENLDLYEEWIRKFYLPQVYHVIQKHLEEYRKV